MGEHASGARGVRGCDGGVARWALRSQQFHVDGDVGVDENALAEEHDDDAVLDRYAKDSACECGRSFA